MSPYCTSSSLADCSDADKRTYDLVGVSKHLGGMGGGHYIAFCRSSLDGDWYEFDDSWAKKVSAQDVEEDRVGAYVLFYLRRDQRPESFGKPPAPAAATL